MLTSLRLQILRPGLASTSARALASRRTLLPSTPRSSFHALSAAASPYKDTQDRESVKMDKDEQSKTSRTGDVMDNDDAAFNPNRTDPESEKQQAATNDGKPLDVSAANPEVSRSPGDGQDGGKETGAGEETRKTKGASRAANSAKGTRA